MKFLKIAEDQYLNIDQIILIEDFTPSYPNNTTIIYFHTGPLDNKNGYKVIPMGINEVIKLLKENESI